MSLTMKVEIVVVLQPLVAVVAAGVEEVIVFPSVISPVFRIFVEFH